MTYRPERMKFGIFLAPYHALGENPTVALQRDVELIQHLDRLGFDEAWVGEHHSMGREIVPDPVGFISYAAAKTTQIALGTGVASLSYHHPLTVADRMVQLDHLTRGRAMLGVGPGALTSDAYMMGIDPMSLRRRMNESLEAIVALLEAQGPVSRETDWFTLRDATIQVPSFTRPHLPVAVAAILTPSGPTAAGRNGVGVISVGGFDDAGFARTWQWTEEAAAESGKRVSREHWRVVAPVHIAETRAQAIADVRDGFRTRAYFGDRGALPGDGGAVANALGLGGASIEEAMERGSVIVGSPDDAIEAIQQIQERSGGFGAFLALAHEWANPQRTHRSYELWARLVAPVFQNLVAPILTNVRWFEENGAKVNPSMTPALRAAFADAGKPIPAKVDEGLGV